MDKKNNLSILTINCYSENNIKLNSTTNKYSSTDRYEYIYRWLKRTINTKKHSPDIICFQNVDIALWNMIKKYHEDSDNILFTHYLSIFSYFDNLKKQEFIEKKIKNKEIIDKKLSKFSSMYQSPGMLISINIKTVDIIPISQPQLIKTEFLDISELFSVEYLKLENAKNIKELLCIYWSFQNMSLFLNSFYDKSEYDYQKFSQIVCLVHKETNIPFMINNISLQDSNINTAIRELKCIDEYNNYIKNIFSIDPHVILVGEINYEKNIFENEIKMLSLEHIKILNDSDFILFRSTINNNFNLGDTVYPEFDVKHFPNLDEELFIKQGGGRIINDKYWFSNCKSHLFVLPLESITISTSYSLEKLNEKILCLFSSPNDNCLKKIPFIFNDSVSDNKKVVSDNVNIEIEEKKKLENIKKIEEEEKKNLKENLSGVRNTLIEQTTPQNKTSQIDGELEIIEKLQNQLNSEKLENENQFNKNIQALDDIKLFSPETNPIVLNDSKIEPKPQYGGNDIEDALDLLVSSINKINKLKKDIHILQKGGTKRKIKKMNKLTRKNII